MKKNLYILLTIVIGLGILMYFYTESVSVEIPTEQVEQTSSSEKEIEGFDELEEEDNAAPHDILLGKFTLEDLNSGINKEWFENNYKNSSPNKEIVDDIAKNLENKDLSIKVFMGTWCADSQLEIPMLMKILDQVDFDKRRISFEGVDEDKIVQGISDEERRELNVYNVPTIIVYDKNGKEMNRFVEFPQETLEKDLLKIISGQDYKHVYDF